MTKWFNNWEWLKCSSGNWNYARIMGVICIMWNLVHHTVIPIHIENITSGWQVVWLCRGMLIAIFLFLFEIIRDYKNVQVRSGDKEVNLTKSATKNNNDPGSNRTIYNSTVCIMSTTRRQ